MRRQIFVLRGLNFSYYATQAILLPFIPLYFVAKGFTPFEIGILMMLGPLIAVIAQPVCGYVSDRLNTVKKVILITWLLMLLASVGLFTSTEFVTTLLFITLLYMFLLPTVPLLDSLAIKSTQHAGISYGSVRLWGSVGFTLVAFTGGYVIDLMGGIENVGYLYWLIWILPLGLLFFLKDEKNAGARVTLSALKKVWGNSTFLWFLFLIFLIAIPHRMNDGLFGLYLDELGATSAMIGWAWALAALSEIPTFALLSRYMHRFHELTILGIVAFLYTIRWSLYAWINEPWLLISLQMSHSVTFAVFWIVALSYTVRLVPDEFRTTGQSLLSAVFLGLAGITGGMAGGWLQENWGSEAMYIFAAIVTLCAGILLFITQYLRLKKSSLI